MGQASILLITIQNLFLLRMVTQGCSLFDKKPVFHPFSMSLTLYEVDRRYWGREKGKGEKNLFKIG